MLLLRLLCGFNCGVLTKVMCVVVCVTKFRVPLGAPPPSWWVVYLLLVIFAALPVVVGDNLGTLRTYQRVGCDDEVVTLKCPHGTSISVHVAQYGKTSPSTAVCPQRSSSTGEQEPPLNVTCLWPTALQTVVEACQKKRQCKFQTSPKTFGGDPCPGVRKYVEVAYKCRPYEFRSKVACENDVVPLKCNPNARIAVYSASYGRTEYESIQCPQPQGVPEETCLVSYATETVMNICHGKRRCTLSADSATFGSPCKPESRMYLKVVYTCVPRKVLKEHFEEQPLEDELAAAATGDSLDDDDDIDGYDTDEFFRESAAFSPSPNLGGNPLDRNLTKDFTQRTTPRPPPHDKARGGAADIGKSGLYTTPRPPYNNLFVPSHYPADPATTKDMQGDDFSDEKFRENTNCTITIYTNEKTRVIGFISEWLNAYKFLSQNQEKFYLYLILSITAGLLLFLGLVIGRLLVQRHRARSEAKFHATAAAEHALPNGFADDISEIDADIDLTVATPVPVPVVAVHSPPGNVAEVVRYGSGASGTLRRGQLDQDVGPPRSLNRGGNSQYYYG
ncbi:uncharacterized protein LOC110836293 isoform X2 [Zootermopsis nevadensis]|uniref:uncharacterized protein LOC110836293 isoform X2 n=1 Tax=Zootermopsis nevadensis TaxID=136037 RepID=UPI000B8EC950|nr:uncharacterized protein LOC110836293 isoform X2 [Zootermopsis nevadensis]